MYLRGFPGGSVVKNLPDNAGDSGLILGLGRSLGGRSVSQPKYSPVFLENLMDRGTLWAIDPGVAKS